MSTAIVVEGGGQRGIYAAGVLDTFLHQDFNPFTIGVAVSSGAQNLLSYFLAEHGYAHRVITELTTSKDFFVPYRWIGNRSIIDLDEYFEHSISDPEFLLPYQRIDSLKRFRQLQFVATAKETLTPVYLEPDSTTAIDYLKATSAVPFLYRDGVEIDGEILVDGGVADPLPLQHAWELGATRILLIRSVPVSDDSSSWHNRLTALGLTKALPKHLQQMMEVHEHAYQQSMAFIASPPDGLELIQIAPEEPLQSFVFGSRSEALSADYVTGLKAGKSKVAQLSHWRHDQAVHSRTAQPNKIDQSLGQS